MFEVEALFKSDILLPLKSNLTSCDLPKRDCSAIMTSSVISNRRRLAAWVICFVLPVFMLQLNKSWCNCESLPLVDAPKIMVSSFNHRGFLIDW